MANEISQRIALSVTKNGATASFSANTRITMAGDDYMTGTQNIGTTAEVIALGDITGAPSQIAIKNLDATNFVEIGGDSGLTVFKLKIRPGHSQLFEPSAATIYAKADTAACRIQILAIEA
jgi:hypothetical protein